MNTHSLIEKDYEKKLIYFTDIIAEIKPEIISLQEVNQSADAKVIPTPKGFVCCDNNSVIKEDNYALKVVKLLSEKGINYNWTWIYIKNSYGKYNEGLAILSRREILKTEIILLTKTGSYDNFKKRMALGVLVKDIWYYNVHLGWLFDKEEAFSNQWCNLKEKIKNHKKVYVMGDFNIDPLEHKTGYDLIVSSGLEDCYTKALIKDSGITVNKKIDGWESNNKNLRLDYVFAKGAENIRFCKTIFNGKDSPLVSDHFGVIVKGD